MARFRSGTSFEPDERSHAAAAAIAAEGKESRRVGVGTPGTARHLREAEGVKPPPRERGQVALTAAARVRGERDVRTRVGREKSGAHLVADLEMPRRDRRS